jgi:1-acyl-sn-glycerol-3-phosphate acyltransferase
MDESAEQARPHWQSVGSQVARGGNVVTRWLGRLLLRAMGWKLSGRFPDRPKFIIAVVPHTSNVDFLLTIGVIWQLGIKASYLAKASLFRFPLGLVMRAFGGIPVDRSTSQGLVDRMVESFGTSDRMILGITPAGTRTHALELKQGVALIAQAANVPILPAVLDYEARLVRFADLIDDVSNPEATLETLRRAALSGRGRVRPV